MILYRYDETPSISIIFGNLIVLFIEYDYNFILALSDPVNLE